VKALWGVGRKPQAYSRYSPTSDTAIMAGLNVQAWFGEPALRVLVRWGMLHLQDHRS
jgi:hypothetical protein